MKNILVVQGGGRPNGNTSQLVRSFVKGAEEAGHKTISLRRNCNRYSLCKCRFSGGRKRNGKAS